MTRKHFIAIAEILAQNSADNTLVECFCDYLRTQNPNFNESQFKAYIDEVTRECFSD